MRRTLPAPGSCLGASSTQHRSYQIPALEPFLASPTHGRCVQGPSAHICRHLSPPKLESVPCLPFKTRASNMGELTASTPRRESGFLLIQR